MALKDSSYFTTLDESNPLSTQAKEIIEKELAGKTPVEHPIGLFTIGAPGAGKTPLLRKLARDLNGDAGQVPLAINKASWRTPNPIPLADPSNADEKNFDNTLYINTGDYREPLARKALSDKGLVEGEDFNNPNGNEQQRKKALAYLGEDSDLFKGEEREALFKNVWKTGAEIARQLLILGVEKGYNTVLDSTGGGFVEVSKTDSNDFRPSDDVTKELLCAARQRTDQGKDVQLIWLRVDVPPELAYERVEKDHTAGKKAFKSMAAIKADIARAEVAPGKIAELAKELGVQASFVTVNQQFKLDHERSHFPAARWMQRASGNGMTP